MKSAQSIKKLPKTKGGWLLGDTLEIVRNPLLYIGKKQKVMGDVYEVDARSRKVMVVADPDIAKYILQENNRQFVKSYDYELLKIALGNGLLTSEGDFWLRQRRLTQPAFHKKRLALLWEIMMEESLSLRDKWKGYQAANTTFDMMAEMMEVTVRIVARALFGTNVAQKVSEIGTNITVMVEYFAERSKNPFLPPLWVPTPFNLRYRKAHNRMDKLIYQIIGDRRKAYAENQTLGDDLLAMYMEVQDEDTGERMTDQQLRDEIITLFIAGHETSATSLTWTFLLLAHNPDERAKLRAELDEVLQGNLPTPENIRQLTRTRRVLDESMRMYPPAWVVGRRPIAPLEIDGYAISSKMNIIISTYLIHRHPDFWENPDGFDPDRFLPERSADRHKYAYFPFGGGPRLCIGNNFALQEMTLLLAVLVQAFEPVSKGPFPACEPLVTLRPKGKIPFIV